MRKQLLLNTWWCLLATVFARFGTLFAFLLVIRWLGPDAYGQVALTQSTILMTGGCIGIGLGMVATKFIAELRHASPAQAGSVLLFTELLTIAAGLLAAAALIAARDPLSQWSIGSHRLAPLLALSAPLLVATTYNFYQVGVLSGFDSFRQISYANGLGAIVSIPFIVLGVWTGGISGTIIAMTLSAIANCAIFHHYVRRACRDCKITRRWIGDSSRRQLLWQYCLPAVLASSITAPIDWAGFALLARMTGGVHEVGVYCAANQWCLMLRMLPMAIGAALMTSVASKAAHAGECNEAARSAIRFVAWLAVPASLLIALASPWIMRCYGSGFTSRWPVLALLMVAAAAISLQLTCERILTGLGRMWLCFWINLGRGLLFCLGAAWLVRYGADGLAISRSATCVLHALLLLAATLVVTSASQIGSRVVTRDYSSGKSPAPEMLEQNPVAA